MLLDSVHSAHTIKCLPTQQSIRSSSSVARTRVHKLKTAIRLTTAVPKKLDALGNQSSLNMIGGGDSVSGWRR